MATQVHQVNSFGARVVASIVGCLPVAPLLAMAGVVVGYTAPLRNGVSALAGAQTFQATVAGLGAWLILVLAFQWLGLPTVRRANTRIYGQLCERLDDLDQRLLRLAWPRLLLTPHPVEHDEAVPTTGIYRYAVKNNTANSQSGFLLCFRFPGKSPEARGPQPQDWTVTVVGDEVRYAVPFLAGAASAAIQIAVVDGAAVAVEVLLGPGPGSEAALDLPIVITPDLAQHGAPIDCLVMPGAEALREAQAHRDFIAQELDRHSGGLRWVLATGYINLWSRIHRAEEALIDIEPRAQIIGGALNDELRLMGSTVEHRDELLAELRAAVKALSPAASATLLKLPPHDVNAAQPPPPAEARAALRHVRNTINEVRDSNWDGLVRMRNHLAASILLTGLVTYALLAFVVSQTTPVPRSTISAVAGLYLIGAVVGLFNQLFSDSQGNRAVEDYGLYFARLVNIPLFSGLAAVFGVALTVLLPTAVDPTLLGKGVGVPSMIDVYSLGKHPLDPVIAAVFGLTPNLLITRLGDEAARFKTNISSTNAASHA